MKNYKILLFILLLSICCERSTSQDGNVLEKYRKLMKAVSDSAFVVPEVGITNNEVLASLMAKKDWTEQKIYFKNNPFFNKNVSSTVKKPVQKTEPEVPVKKAEIKIKEEKPINYELTGIIQIGSTKKALINGDLYQTGDKINDSEILEIDTKYVTLKNSKGINKLYLKEK